MQTDKDLLTKRQFKIAGYWASYFAPVCGPRRLSGILESKMHVTNTIHIALPQ